MEKVTPDDFERMKNDAAERLRKMTRRDMPPFPNFVKIPESSPTPTDNKQTILQPQHISVSEKQNKRSTSSLLKYLNIPEMLKSSDAMLLLALILLLSNEDADETLILALAYILL